jgi:hypothetical protein
LSRVLGPGEDLDDDDWLLDEGGVDAAGLPGIFAVVVAADNLGGKLC